MIFHVIATSAHDRPVFEDPSVVVDIYRALQALHDVGVAVLAYCLMSAHAHLLLRVRDEGELAWALNRLLAPAAYNLNRRLQQRGGIFCHKTWRMPAESEPYLWVLPLYIHANPAPHTTDLRRLSVGLRSSHDACVSGDYPDWLSPGPILEQYAGAYLAAMQEFLDQRGGSTAAEPRPVVDLAVLAVARLCGVRPSTLLCASRGGKRDRMLLAWLLVNRSGAGAAGDRLNVHRVTAASWARHVAADPTLKTTLLRLGGPEYDGVVNI